MALRNRRPRRAIRRRKAAGRRPRSRVPRSMGAMNQSCHVVETITDVDLAPNVANKLRFDNFHLKSFPRAYAMARYFKWYKAVEVEWTYETFNNTYQQDAGQAGPTVSKPYYAWIMNRTQDLQPLNATKVGGDPKQILNTAGVTWKSFAGKVVIKYKPNFLVAGQSIGLPSLTTDDAISSIYTTNLQPSYRYLACPDMSVTGSGTEAVIPSQVGLNTTGNLGELAVYGAHYFLIDQATSAPTEPIYRVACKVKWHFKNPNWVPPGSLNEPLKPLMA